MKSNKENWFTLLILSIVVLFIFIKEDAFSKEKQTYITYLEIYGKEIPLEKEKREYTVTLNEIHIKKIGMEELPVCTCEITKINYEKDKYEINTNTISDTKNKKETITINVTKIGEANVLDSYKIYIMYQNEMKLEEECKTEYICPSF